MCSRFGPVAVYAASLVLLALLVGFAAGVACADGCWCWLLVLVHVLLALLVLVHVLVVSGGVRSRDVEPRNMPLR